MAKYEKGILGAVSGKVGTVVGATWRGKDVLRSVPKKSAKPASQSQLLQREKFAMMSKFLVPLSPIINLYYGVSGGDKTRLNRAMSYHMKEAIEVNQQGFKLKYNKVVLTKGDLVGLQGATARSSAANELEITWVNNAGQGEALATDKLVLAVYNPQTSGLFTSLAAADRNKQQLTVTLGSGFQAGNCEVWASVVSVDGKRYATSMHLGTVTVQ